MNTPWEYSQNYKIHKSVFSVWSASGFKTDNKNLYPANNYFFKVNTRKMFEICSKITIKTAGQHHHAEITFH